MATDIVEAASFGVLALLLVASGLASALVKRTFHSVMFLGVFLVGVAALYVLLGSPLVGVIQILVYVGGILTLFVFAVMFVAGDEKEEMEENPAPAPRSRAWTLIAGALVAGGALFIASTYVVTANRWAAGFLGGHVDSADKWVANDLAMAVGFVAGILFIVAVAIGALLAWLGVRHALDRWSGTRIFGTALAGLLFGTLAAVVAGASPCLPQVVCVDANAGWGTDAAATEANVAAANDLSNVLASLFTTNAIAFEILGVLLTAVMIGALVLARPLAAPADEEHYAKITPEQLRQSQEVSDVHLHASGPPAASTPPPPASGASAEPAPGGTP